MKAQKNLDNTSIGGVRANLGTTHGILNWTFWEPV